jgi:F-type H+-transporting ATPase subunit b
VELDWSTFILEIINFLVLVWLLKRFFYKPVLNVINRRREEIQKKISETEGIRREAESLKSDYEHRLADWEDEKAAARTALNKEIEAQRKRMLDELHATIEQEREKERVLNQRKIENEQRRNEKLAMEQALAFTSRLLTRLATPQLEARIVQLAIEDLEKLSGEQQTLLQKAYAQAKTPVTVSSAFPLKKEHTTAIEKRLTGILNQPPTCEYRQDPDLLAGLRISVGSWMLKATLQDELKYFADAGNDRQ